MTEISYHDGNDGINLGKLKIKEFDLNSLNTKENLSLMKKAIGIQEYNFDNIMKIFNKCVIDISDIFRKYIENGFIDNSLVSIEDKNKLKNYKILLMKIYFSAFKNKTIPNKYDIKDINEKMDLIETIDGILGIKYEK